MALHIHVLYCDLFLLFPGCIIVGLQPVDDNWWQGKIGGNVGIFPVTHVLELEISKLLRNRSKSVHSSEPLFAQALCDSVAQLDEELGFKAGDIITVTEVIDEDWYQGEVHGKSGMFLASCVQLLNESVNENDIDDTTRYHHSFLRKDTNDNQRFKNEYNVGQHNNIKTKNIRDDSRVHENEVSRRSGEFLRDRTISYTSENTKSHNINDDGVTPYARTLYPFVGELENELTFDANDIVTLIQHIDEQWIEGEIDGNIGLFPANYVEIVVDCPYAYPVGDSDREIIDESVSEQSNFNLNSQYDVDHSKAVLGNLRADSSHLASSANESKSKTATPTGHAAEDVEEHFALVLYSFDAETSQDLSVSEGETVTVIRQVDENWVLVENEQGNRGMCPASFIDLIGTIPDFTHTAHVENGSELQSVKEINAQPSCAIKSKIDSLPSPIKEECVPVSEIKSEEKSDSHGAIRTSQSLDSIYNSTTSKAKTTGKPPLKPKPQLAPKPNLKPKPPVSPRAVSKTAHTSANSNLFIPKSESSSSLSGHELENLSPNTQTGNLAKSNSMFEINDSKADTNVCTNQPTHTEGHNGGMTSLSRSDSDPKKTQQRDSKKAFENLDVNQPIESFIQSEFLKAAESRSRSGSSRSSSSGDSLQRSGSYESPEKSKQTSKSSVRGGPNRPVSWAVGSSSVNFSPPKPKTTPNYSRTNFYSKSDVTVGNSTFFVDDPQVSVQSTSTRGRFSNKENETYRKPSLRKSAPPRPTGPRIAPAPSRTPLSPLKADSKPVPARPAPSKPQQTPSRPGSRPRKHVRPAPPRPQPGKAQPKKINVEKPKVNSDNLMSFSPTNSSVGKFLTVL